MPLSTGDRVGTYEVIGELGAGGMGIVYRARDTKLDRDVALKVLPEAFTSDPDRLARFEREAKVLASLNHPNIGHIYGLEESADTRALVLELVEGPTLADLIARHPAAQPSPQPSPRGRGGEGTRRQLASAGTAASSRRIAAGSPSPVGGEGRGEGGLPVDEALAIARQIAEALEAAHESGIIHRDLKPANVKVRDDGTVKVLDFGLAKAFQPEASDPGLSASPTISLTAAATEMGMVIGTAAYMSPEQAKGKAVDKRADIWAFGAVLYEMLAGERAFAGGDVSETLAQVIMKEVDLTALPAAVPPSTRTLIGRCLERDPRQRLRDIGEARIQLERPTDAAASPGEPAPAGSGTWGRALPFAAGALLLGALASGLAVWTLRPRPQPLPVSRAAISVPPSAPVAPDPNFNDVAISPDGSRIVYQGQNGTEPQLYVRALDQFESVPLRGAAGGGHPFVSPDGEWVGFTDGTALLKVSILGGPPVTIVPDLPALLRGAVWGADDTIVFGTASGSGLLRVSAAGGEVTAITDAADGRHLWPDLLPNGTHVLFTVSPSAGSADDQIALLDLDTGDHRVIIANGTAARYAPTGHIVYALEGTLRAVSFDLASLEVGRDPVPVVEQVLTKGGVAAAAFDLSDTGSLVYVTGGPVGGGGFERLVWVDREASEDPLPIPEANYGTPRLSPDGTRLAASLQDGDRFSLWVYEVATGAGLRLTTQGTAGSPVWTPDGARLAFAWQREETPGLYWVPADGSGAAELLTTRENNTFDRPAAVTPDGQTLIFTRNFSGAHAELWEVPLEGDRTPRPLLQGEFQHRGGAVLDPGGAWLAYHSDQSSQFEVYVQPYPGPGPTVPVSIGGGSAPVWSSDGSELIYLRPTAVMAADVTTDGDQARVVARRELFPSQSYVQGRSRQHDLGPDGQLLMLTVRDLSASDGALESLTQVVLVQHWFEELVATVPVP